MATRRRILVVGSGAREHAICWKLSTCPSVEQVYCAPGNPGVASSAKLVPIGVDNLPLLIRFAKDERIDLTIVGPEYPLSLGLVDEFRSQGLRVFGPTKQAALLEGSKSFAKEVMIAAGVRTAKHREFFEADPAHSYVREHGAPIVIKADGLAAGKGVYVCDSIQAAESAIKSLFGELSAHKIVVEDFLSGVEASYISATDGHSIIPLATSHDYKRLLDSDRGPNTGGMGSVSPTPRLDEEMCRRVDSEVLEPVLEEMAARGTPFSGFIYAGLMIENPRKIHVLEFNCRLGDPECQVIMRRMQSDLCELIWQLTEPTPGHVRMPEWSEDSAVCVVMASAGYPDQPVKGDEIVGLEMAGMLPDTVVFHAGTVSDSGKLLTAGGRVLSVTARGPDVQNARQKAYRAVDMIQFRGRQLRRDIGL